MDQLGSPYVDHLDPICVVDRAELEEKKGNENGKYKMRVKTFFRLLPAESRPTLDISFRVFLQVADHLKVSLVCK